MKNDKIIISWNKIKPSDSANERMLSAILERNRSMYHRNKKEIVQRKQKIKKMLILFGACFIVAVVIVGILMFNKSRTSVIMSPLSVSASELGMEEYIFGVELPSVIYGDDGRIIMYDFRGVYVYDLKNEKLTGYADFRPINMTLIQGDNPTFVEASSDGKLVKFYNNEKKYLYDVEINEIKEVINYNEITEDFQEGVVEVFIAGDKESLSKEYTTYKMKDGSLIAVILVFNPEFEDDVPKYRNLYLIREVNNERFDYAIFQ
ncbi:MAG: hypothetical protein IJ224_06065 [Lachnospiraceae bacterium]|nr:hypothetical protein [Lachnospiraceae bacterium]